MERTIESRIVNISCRQRGSHSELQPNELCSWAFCLFNPGGRWLRRVDDFPEGEGFRVEDINQEQTEVNGK